VRTREQHDVGNVLLGRDLLPGLHHPSHGFRRAGVHGLVSGDHHGARRIPQTEISSDKATLFSQRRSRRSCLASFEHIFLSSPLSSYTRLFEYTALYSKLALSLSLSLSLPPPSLSLTHIRSVSKHKPVPPSIPRPSPDRRRQLAPVAGPHLRDTACPISTR